MNTVNENPIPDPREIEKELGEFLNKKFGGSVQIVSPSMAHEHAPVKEVFPETSKKNLINFDMKPADLIQYLDQYVVRQEKAKSILATKICTHFNRIRHQEENAEHCASITGNIKSNILMLGPTGIGKTYLIKLIAKKIGVPFIKADATKFSETGYVGGDVEDLIRDLVKEADNDIELAQCGIVYIDEVDKIAASPNVIGSQISRTGVQRALLKPMEETDVDLKVPHDPVSMMQELEQFQRTGQRSQRKVNTANILFILSGAFSGLTDIIKKRLTKQTIGFGANIAEPVEETGLLGKTRAEDLVSYGFESEFIGRLPVRCVLEPLEQEDLYQILSMPNNPVILSKRLDFLSYGIGLVFTDKALRLLAEKAYKENTGARGLVSAVEDALLLFEEKLPSSSVTRLLVTEELIKEPEKTLEALLSGEQEDAFSTAYEKAEETCQEAICEHITQHWKRLSLQHGITLTQSRCQMVARYFMSHVVEINEAVRRIKSFHDSIKEIQLTMAKEYDFDITFEEDAVDFLMEQYIDHNATNEEIIFHLHENFHDGLNLIREKTGKYQFTMTREALSDHNTYLTNLIKKELS